MKTADFVLNGATAILALAAVSVSVLAVDRYLGGRRNATFGVVRDFHRYAEAGHWMGRPGAPVTIVEFSDFHCPYCKNAAETLREMVDSYPHKVAVLFRHFPIDELHPRARKTANAAECAAEQGRFREFHDFVFLRQALMDTLSFTVVAEAIGGLDTAAFAECTRSDKYATRVSEDFAMARELGVVGTPTLLVNSRIVRGAPRPRYLDSLVRAELRSVR
ncbi:MAG: DsbA family protein [Gemmatimonadales bacterium]